MGAHLHGMMHHRFNTLEVTSSGGRLNKLQSLLNQFGYFFEVT